MKNELTQEEVTKIISSDPKLLQILINAKKNNNSQLEWKIFAQISGDYGYKISQLFGPERAAFLFEKIESELSYYSKS